MAPSESMAPVADAMLYFLRLGKAQGMRIEPGKLQDVAGPIARVASRLIAARRSGDFPRCRSADCRHCAYGRYCEAVAGEGGRSEA